MVKTAIIARMNNKEKIAFYESATKNLLGQINKMNLAPEDKQKAVYYTSFFREAFKYDVIKQKTFLTRGNKIWDFGYDSAGFCYASSSVFSVIMGLDDWNLMCIDADQWPGRFSHHYLKHVPSGMYFDLTYDQFSVDGYTVPYELGERVFVRLDKKDSPMRFSKALNIDVIGILTGKTKVI